MTAAWVVVAVASFLLAALLAVVDAALVTSGHAATKKELDDPERAHRALALARILAHLVMGTSVALGVLAYGLKGSGAVLVVAALLFVHVVLVEGWARSAGQARAPHLIGRVASSAFVIDLLMRPITMAGALVESGLSRLLPPTDNASVPPTTTGTEQFRELVEAEADVSPAEAELLHGVFSLGDTQVREIMVPRVDITGIDASTPWSEMLDRVRSSEHARFPVFDGELDNLRGILYAKDLLPAVVADESPEEWTRLIRPAAFIPMTKTIDQQLRDFKAQRTHIALVMDEYGGIQGVVTIEDVLEEIVGEIHDEFDEVDPGVVQEEGQRYWVSGSLSLADLSELVGTDFQREDLTTVGGLVYEAFGRVPRAGESRQIDGFRVVVERVRRRRVERVYLERVQPEHAA